MKKTILSILTLSIFNVISITLNIPVSALTYSDNVGVNFTFSPSLTVSLSSPDLVINGLTPGTSSDSNVITVNVLSNNANGYELKSTVGNTTYANRNLTHTSSNAIFSSLDYATTPTIASPSDFNDNTWGYSYATNYIEGSSTELDWANYSGLPKYDDEDNVATLRTNPGPSSSTGDDTYFKIAAKASPTQASGTYGNVINFTVVGAANPTSFYDAFKEAQAIDPTITTLNGYYKMQDMTPAICNAIEQEESQMSLIDVRDHNVYTVAKLKDNRCWMTTNLNLKGGTELSYEDTDIPEGYILPIANGFGENNVLPVSSMTGFNNDSIAHVYNTGNDTSNCASPGCYSYYSWTAVTAGSGVDISSENSDAPHSICPKNWKLPTSRYSDPFDIDVAAESNFYLLAISYGLNTGAWEQNSASFYDNVGPGTIPNFLPAGHRRFSELYSGGTTGNYWSSTGSANGYARDLYFHASYSGSSNTFYRMAGFPVRCLAKNS